MYNAWQQFPVFVLVVILHGSLSALLPIKGSTKVGSLMFSPIGCGTWAWGNRFLWGYSTDDDIELQKAYNFVVSKGVNWFDTADSYGTGALVGRSEELLGQFASQNKAKVSFITKLAPYPFRIGERSMIDAAAESSTRLKRPIDMVQLHWPPISLQVGQEAAYLRAFAQLVREKKATQIGVSNYGPKTLRRAGGWVGKN